MKVAIIIISLSLGLNSCTSIDKTLKKQNDACYEDSFTFSDTIKLSIQDYQIIHEHAGTFTIKVINKVKLDQISELLNPLIIICKNGNSYRAKGNLLVLSGAPDDCDYYYPTINERVYQNPIGEIIFRGPLR